MDATESQAVESQAVESQAAEAQPVDPHAVDPREVERLRRQLRALSLVNRQLHAQLEGGTMRVVGATNNGSRGALTVRRTAEGGAWLEHLHLQGGGDPMLVRTPNNGAFVVEGQMRRPVKSGILFTALTHVMGAAREMTDHDVERWSSGPPVEVLEAGTGPAFVVVGGRRLPLRGLPLPYLVSTDDMLLFPEGEELNVAITRAAPPSRAARARKMIEKEGAVRGGTNLLRKGLRRVTPAAKPPS